MGKPPAAASALSTRSVVAPRLLPNGKQPSQVEQRITDYAHLPVHDSSYACAAGSDHDVG